MNRGWIGVDLDGTLAEYHGWVGIEHIGAPVPAMIERVKGWLAEGQDVRIFTSRVCGGDGSDGCEGVVDPDCRDTGMARKYVQEWCFEHLGQVLPVTNIKDFGMVVLWDDRCVSVERNTGKVTA